MTDEDITIDKTEQGLGGVTVMERLPADVVGELSPDQRQALLAAIDPHQSTGSFPVDLRISMPLFGKRVFIALVSGNCQRGPERQSVDRGLHPVATLGNLVVSFFTLIGIVCTAFVILAVWSGILSF